MFKAPGKWFGLFLILSFLSYGIGMGFMEIINTPALQPAEVTEQINKIVTGGLLVTVFHTLFNIVLLLVMFNSLVLFHRMLSGLYLVTGLVATVMLAFGGICLMLPVSLSEQVNGSVKTDHVLFSAVAAWCSTMNFYAYQIGMFIWGIAGLLLCYLLNKSRLVPFVFTVWGCIGYLVFITGTVLELFGLPVGVPFSIPGGLFEITLSVWLIWYGFRKNVP